MKIAFYAPLKSPNHAIPSGDRAMGRALISALKAGSHQVTLASELRIYDSEGSREVQTQLRTAAAVEIERITKLGQLENWQAWLTYHNYYKAPDLIGPRVAQNLNIPYVLVEATRAKKRLNGPWAGFAIDAEAASDAADAIMYLTARDAEALERDAPAGQRLVHLRPFLDMDDLPAPSTNAGPMLSVGMMRHGDKLASYQLIADTLKALPQRDWQLNLAGDGPAFQRVEQMMAPFGNRVRLLGALDAQGLAQQYSQASLLFWPGVNEAFGLTYLEAQAYGVPVVAQNRPGVRDVIYGEHPRPFDGVQALVDGISELLEHPKMRRLHGVQARHYVATNHLLGAAANTLDAVLANVTGHNS